MVPDLDPLCGPGLSAPQRAGLRLRRADDDRTLAAMHAVEAALAAAAPGREPAWRDALVTALATLEQATGDEQANADEPDSLLSDIARTQPRLRTAVRGLRAHYRQLHAAVASMRADLDDPDALVVDFADIRQRLGWVLAALRHQQARESDVIYEAYYEAFNAPLAPDDGVEAPRCPGGT
jgi:ATP phosphoribosyltransferase regulatory subunit HisZ